MKRITITAVLLCCSLLASATEAFAQYPVRYFGYYPPRAYYSYYAPGVVYPPGYYYPYASYYRPYGYPYTAGPAYWQGYYRGPGRPLYSGYYVPPPVVWANP